MRLPAFPRPILTLGLGTLAWMTTILWAYTTPTHHTKAANLSHFPSPPSSRLPFDVDVALVRQLDAAGRVPEAQRLFDILSWQTFLALNWPADGQGNPARDKTLADTGPRVWDYWRNADTIFLPQGKTPLPWGGPGTSPRGTEVLFRGKAAWRQTRAGENFQAFSGPLVDQNGRWVRYEVLVDREECDYLTKNHLYNLEGQIAYSQRPQGNDIGFPVNDGHRRHGAIEIKLAWKELRGHDDPRRFYTTKAVITEANPLKPGQTKPKTRTVTMGLVGMHIAMRTRSSPEWIWATFEQVDNVSVPPHARTHDGRPLRPNFHNPDLHTDAVNMLAPKNAVLDPHTGQPVIENDPTKATTWVEELTKTPTQVTRVVVPTQAVNPLDARLRAGTVALNAEVQRLLQARHSVFQYYQLIGTQWPVNPNAPAFAGGQGSVPDSIKHKMPGDMVPVFLVNTTMETFFQKGEQKAGGLEQDNRLTDNSLTDSSMVFATESCVGCHYSAGLCLGFKRDGNGKPLLDAAGRRIPIYGENGHFGKTGNANFSWLLQIEARSTHDPAPPARSPAAFLDIGSHPGRHTLPSR